VEDPNIIEIYCKQLGCTLFNKGASKIVSQHLNSTGNFKYYYQKEHPGIATLYNKENQIIANKLIAEGGPCPFFGSQLAADKNAIGITAYNTKF